MKKIIIIIVSIFLFALLMFFIDKYRVRYFSIHDYIGNISDSKTNIGEISNSFDLRKKAKKIWKNTFENEKMYYVFYDSVEDVWMLTGSLPLYCKIPFVTCMGGVGYLVVRGDGTVIEMWHTK